jgi:hypothetical protein
VTLNAQNVNQGDTDTLIRTDFTDNSIRITADALFYEGPKSYVRIPDAPFNLVFIRRTAVGGRQLGPSNLG